MYYNLQTDFDHKTRRIDHNGQKEQCKVLGMEMVRCPIKEYDESDLKDKVKKAAEKLNELLELGNVVYINCTSGIGRAASVLVMYLVLYKSYSVKDAVAYVKRYRRVVCPNVEVVEDIVNAMHPDVRFGYNDYTACIAIDISRYAY